MTNNENRKIMDVTNIIPNNHPDKIRLEVFLDGSLNVLLKYGFNLDNFNDFDQSNIMDGQQGVVEKTENWKAKTRRSPAFLKQSTSTQNINPINLPYVPFPSSYLYSAPLLHSKCGGHWHQSVEIFRTTLISIKLHPSFQFSVLLQNLRGSLFGRLAQQFKSKKGSMIYVTTNDENKELAEEYGIKCLILESKDALIKLRNNLDGSDQTICELAKFVAKF
uniref:Uncharacterized protein n=1 Tax=Meloidogyne hapla TaxID=6305 RepID=A0A1I8BV70_MELHA